MRTAVYTGTRNLYKHMIPAIKSLLINSNVQKIYLLIQDEVFPYELPAECECINVSNQTFFPLNGPNMNSQFTYMAMMRATLSKLFPNLDQILSLDVDTIIEKDISNLWNLNLDDYYLAATPQPSRCKGGHFYSLLNCDTYVNIGVVVYNLKKIRQDCLDDKVILQLNTNKYRNLQQDVFNILCQKHILCLPGEYNANDWCKPYNENNIKIKHYAAIKNWYNEPLIQKYKNIPFSQIRRKDAI